MRAWITLGFLVVVCSGARSARAAEPNCFAEPSRWNYDRGKETLAKPGERFLDDMQKCDATFAAAVVEAVRYQIQDEEQTKFVRQSRYVIAAYGVAWGLLALSGLFLFLRQRRLGSELAALEAKLRAAGDPS